MKVFLDTVGCRLNQSEIEHMAAQFRAAGHSLVDSPEGADMVVVNTCTVTDQAAADSRQKIRHASRFGANEIIATGCWASLEPQAAANLPGVSRVIPNERKDHLVGEVLGLPEEIFDREPLARKPLPGLRQRTRAFLKVQDGCDNHCTFCITRIARGKGHSRVTGEILKDVELALAGGSQEIVLTGVHLGSWGQDFSPAQHLYDLVAAILGQTTPPRLRLSSLEPWDLDEHFFGLWSDARLCRHLHLPLQSGAETTLKRMARKTTPELFSALVEQARKAAPDIAITTDVIVGFPGETDLDFEDSLEFVRRMEFAGGHVFHYSPRPGTPSASYARQVPPPVRKERSARMRAVLLEAEERYYRHFSGERLPVLWESTDASGPEGWRLQGLTDNYLRVSAAAPRPLWNEFSLVELGELHEGVMHGQIVNPA